MNRLLELRLQSGLTVEALAKKAKLSPTTVTRLETGQTKSYPLTIAKLANVLGVPVNELSDLISIEKQGQHKGPPQPSFSNPTVIEFDRPFDTTDYEEADDQPSAEELEEIKAALLKSRAEDARGFYYTSEEVSAYVDAAIEEAASLGVQPIKN